MARIVLPRSLADETGGQLEFDLDGDDVRSLIRSLDALHPGVGGLIEGRMAVAIDGEIHADPLLEPVGEASEVHFLPRVGGG